MWLDHTYTCTIIFHQQHNPCPETDPLSFFAAILNIMAGLEVVSMCAEANWLWETTQELPGPQYTRANAIVPGTVPGAGFNPRYTLYSVIVPALLAGGSQDKCAPSELYIQRGMIEPYFHCNLLTLLMRIAEGAPGKPGIQVLKAATSENKPLPQEFIPHTLNLYAFPGWSSTFWTLGAGDSAFYRTSNGLTACMHHQHTSDLLTLCCGCVHLDIVAGHSVLCPSYHIHIIPLRNHLLLCPRDAC